MAVKPKKRSGKTKTRRARARRKEVPEETTRYCDVVMKGGITSGVAYPLAMCELARVFHFRNIGGTSTGAIAAAYTAAAEYSRQRGGQGFDDMESLPAWFGKSERKRGKSNLFCLFQPDRPTAPVFNLIAASLRGRRHPVFRAVRVGLAILRSFPWHILVGVLPGIAFGVLAVLTAEPPGLWTDLAAAVFLVAGGAIIWVLIGIGWIVGRRLPRNFYGLCSGYAARRPGVGPALTQWVHETIARVAGRDAERDPPLTFGDLWGEGGRENPAVNLQMMATNLTQLRPVSIPFHPADQRSRRTYFFDPDEMRRLYPPEIVDWMIEKSPVEDDHRRFAPLLPLPDDADLPVAFGVRLSVAYPVLLSAVPLYTVDYNRRVRDQDRQPERCWFTDGGITSNFPVHFFDQPLPRWPTFAFNLRQQPPDRPEEEVWMPRSNRERGVVPWLRFEKNGRPSLIGFFSAIKEVTQTWMDHEQMRVPGYRDRIVHISLKPAEGGINLDMPGDVVVSLSERGRRAGRLLVERFVTGPKWDVDLNWENHRWVRYRSTMYALEGLLKHLRDSYRSQQPDARSYAELIKRELDSPPLGYPWRSEAQRAHALEVTESLADMVDGWTEPHQTFDSVDSADPGPPSPAPVFRIMPRH